MGALPLHTFALEELTTGVWHTPLLAGIDFLSPPNSTPKCCPRVILPYKPASWHYGIWSCGNQHIKRVLKTSACHDTWPLLHTPVFCRKKGAPGHLGGCLVTGSHSFFMFSLGAAGPKGLLPLLARGRGLFKSYWVNSRIPFLQSQPKPMPYVRLFPQSRSVGQGTAATLLDLGLFSLCLISQIHPPPSKPLFLWHFPIAVPGSCT